MSAENVSNHLFSRLLEIFFVSLRLGLTSFGGPVAHLGYFRHEYVERRKWIDDNSYADLVALGQFLPGPASSQVGIGIGVSRGGVLGGIVSFLGFTLPSILILIAVAFSFQMYDWTDLGLVQGLKLVAVAVVAHAIYGMGQKLAPDRARASIAIVSLIVILVWQTVWSQVVVILISSIIGYILYKNKQANEIVHLHISLSRKFGAVCLSLFFSLLVALPVMRSMFDHIWLAMFDSFYRAGALVFGGGHVVLPLLEREVVPTGWVTEEAFLTGYGAAQAVPGPLFTFASYLGAIVDGWGGAFIATVAIFLPAFLLILGTLPFWTILRQNGHIRGALQGVNAAVIGILIAAFYQPIFISAVHTPVDFAFAAFMFGLLLYWKQPAWKIVIIGIVGGTVLSYI